MSDRQDEKGDIRELIERSSFGTPDAVAARATVTDEEAARVVAQANELAKEAPAITVDWDDDEDWCDHPPAAVISDIDGTHFCASCNTEWWEDPL